MASGLSALLDDIATIAKVAAASVDDIGAAAGKAGAKAAGVVIDDTAVTPRYVTGFTPDRELPVIASIARGSLFNKIVIILPAALLRAKVAERISGARLRTIDGAGHYAPNEQPHALAAILDEWLAECTP